MYDHILLPTDGTDGMDRAVDHAATLAGKFDSTVHVLSVSDTRNRFESPTGGLSSEAWTEAEHERAETAVEDTVANLPDDVNVETAVVEGVPHSVILEYAENEGMDLVVMATHGRTGLDHYLIGSVAEKVVRRASAPVVTVRVDSE